MTIRDYILARTGEAGGEVEGAEFAYSTSTGRSGVGEAVGTASRVSPGPAEWFSGKTAGGLGLLPLLPFLNGGGADGADGMETAYNEAYGQRAQEISLQDQRQIEIEQKAQAEEEVREQQKKHLSKPMELERFTIKDHQTSEPIQKATYEEDFYRKPAAEEQIQRQTITLKEQLQQPERLDISQSYPEAQKLETVDITKEYPEAQKLETLDITKEYPEAQRMETLDVTKTYPEAQRIDERQVKQTESFPSASAGRSFGEPITEQQQAMEQAYRKAMDPNRSIFERMANYAAYEKEKTASSPARMAAEVGAYGLAAPVIAGGSAALASGVASIPTAISLGAEKAANTISSPAADYENYLSRVQQTLSYTQPQQMEAASKVSQLGNILNPYNIAKGVAGAATAIGGVISSLGAAAESPAISSPGTSGNWDAAEQKVTGTMGTLKTTSVKSSGTSSKTANVTTKISKVR